LSGKTSLLTGLKQFKPDQTSKITLFSTWYCHLQCWDHCKYYLQTAELNTLSNCFQLSI